MSMILLIPHAAIAATNTPLSVTADVVVGCDISGNSTNLPRAKLDFGTAPATGQTILASSTNLIVKCNSATTPIKLTFNGGQYFASGQRRMIGSGGALLAYALFQDMALTQPWDDGVAYSYAAPSSASVQIPVYGRLILPVGTPDGAFSDVVQITLEY